ncbi:MFS transporter [Burkholderia sp. USMB20]|uniref:MFS transporter n=1 Tax=Burkholderia sp. USMB20 TaxID=1571773 RepID=UPI0010923EDB|nr:MFS transporter [Burkholderia sp. USMB20]TGN98601.1 hypothetical protein PL79_006080 [Burkholderia sp. USMB20]
MTTDLVALLGIAFGLRFRAWTIIGHQLAAPAQVGIATASVRALRTMGGLIGVAVTGGLISLTHRAAASSGAPTLDGSGGLANAIRFGHAAVYMSSAATLLISSRVSTVSFNVANRGSR